MRQLLLTLALFAGSVQSQTTISMPVVCDDTDVIISSLKKLDEKPIWFGSSLGDDKTVVFYVIMSNPSTRDWTFLKFNENVACVLSMGNYNGFTEQKKFPK